VSAGSPAPAARSRLGPMPQDGRGAVPFLTVGSVSRVKCLGTPVRAVRACAAEGHLATQFTWGSGWFVPRGAQVWGVGAGSAKLPGWTPRRRPSSPHPPNADAVAPSVTAALTGVSSASGSQREVALRGLGVCRPQSPWTKCLGQSFCSQASSWVFSVAEFEGLSFSGMYVFPPSLWLVLE